MKLCLTSLRSAGWRPVGALLCALAGFAAWASPAEALVNGQIDNFEDGTTDFWGIGGAAPPGSLINVATGGPAGVGDHFLQLTADGNGAGGRLVSFNQAQWLGNYTLAGVNAIEMDLKAFSFTGSSSLNIRIAFRSATGNGAAPGYVSAVALTLVADGQWHHIVFSFASFVPINSPPPLATLLTNPAELRIINAASPNTLLGDNIIGVLGVDNIHAIPEPGTAAAVVALAALAIVCCRCGNLKLEVRNSK